jgi:hypothetical protein
VHGELRRDLVRGAANVLADRAGNGHAGE